MIADIKAVAARSADTLVEDAMGVVALFVLLAVGLGLPAVL